MSSRLTIISLEFKVSLNKLTFEHSSSRLIQYFLEKGIACNVLAQVKDLQVKLDEAEQQAMKGGRKVAMLLNLLFVVQHFNISNIQKQQAMKGGRKVIILTIM